MNTRVSFSYTVTDHCQSCGKDFDVDESRYPGVLRVNTYTTRAGINKGVVTRTFSADCLCKNCLMLDVAHTEANEERRRVTQICAGIPDTNMAYELGARCLCGRVTHHKHDDCLLCRSEERMLSKAQYEAKQFRKILAELNREIKTTIKLQRELNEH